ncbi:MAG: AAA family ATPase [Flavobacteriaceae bacterium]|nr:AAA family ATPase [Flavobacteriaceae bacterium]
MLTQNQAFSKEGKRSNNVKRLKDIGFKLKQEEIYKFTSFFAYYDTLYNKKVYLENTNNHEVKDSKMFSTINLNGASLYKVSHGSFKANKRKHIIDALKENNWITIHESTGKGRGDKFKNQLKEGDYVYITLGGDELIGIARIVSNTCEYIPREIINDDGWLFREIEMIQEPIKRVNQLNDTRAIYPSGNTSLFKVKSRDLQEANQLLFQPYFNVEFIDGDITAPISSKTKSNNIDLPLNQILFGPPGTGKTYHTVNKAIGIVNPNFDLNQDRPFIKAEFDKLYNEGRILFTTFHQSMSYEDFIEGIKPQDLDEDDSFLKYEIESGIFKKACANAGYNCYKEYIKLNTSNSNYSFDDLYDAFIEHILKLLEANNPPVYKTLRGSDVEVKKLNSNNSIIARAKDSIAKKSAPLTKENIQKLYDRFKSISEIDNLNQVKETVQVTPRITEFYAVFGGLKKFEAEVFNPDSQSIIESKEVDILDENEIIKKFNSGVFKEAIKKVGNSASPIVMIIDEINRGNVSQIFGELITLIEKDKRLGNKEALQITLPYSKEPFGVPPNLYIIGTMNTADRSVEALDTALRRRFTFEEIPPDYSLKELDYSAFNYKTSQILKTINSRIEKLLDKDHAIGHSFFIIEEEKDKEQKIIKTFYKNIIPLLQEYFFGDFGKIGLVLGKGFVNKKDWDKIADAFADFDHESRGDFEERDIYEIIDYRNSNHNYKINNVDMSFDKAIQLLMKDSIA